MSGAANLISLLCRMFLAGLFIYSSADKIWDPGSFALAVGQYELLPMPLVNAASVLISWLEGWVGILLLAGLWTRAAAAWAAALLALFTGLMVYAGFTGSGYDCGCFPGQNGHPAGFQAALRDFVMMAPAIWLLGKPGEWLRLDSLLWRRDG